MAPGASLATVKVLDSSVGGSNSWIISAIDDIIAVSGSVDLPIYVASMSLVGSYSAQLDQAVSNTVGVWDSICGGGTSAKSTSSSEEKTVALEASPLGV